MLLWCRCSRLSRLLCWNDCINCKMRNQITKLLQLQSFSIFRSVFWFDFKLDSTKPHKSLSSASIYFFCLLDFFSVHHLFLHFFPTKTGQKSIFPKSKLKMASQTVWKLIKLLNFFSEFFLRWSKNELVHFEYVFYHQLK